VTNPADKGDLVGLEALTGTSPEAEPATGELARDLVRADRQTGGKALDNGDEPTSMGLSSGQEAQHALSLRRTTSWGTFPGSLAEVSGGSRFLLAELTLSQWCPTAVKTFGRCRTLVSFARRIGTSIIWDGDGARPSCLTRLMAPANGRQTIAGGEREARSATFEVTYNRWLVVGNRQRADS